MEIDDDDNEPLFRTEQLETDGDSNKDESFVDIDEDLIKDLINDSETKSKKRKRKPKTVNEEKQEELEEGFPYDSYIS